MITKYIKYGFHFCYVTQWGRSTMCIDIIYISSLHTGIIQCLVHYISGT